MREVQQMFEWIDRITDRELLQSWRDTWYADMVDTIDRANNGDITITSQAAFDRVIAKKRSYIQFADARIAYLEAATRASLLYAGYIA